MTIGVAAGVPQYGSEGTSKFTPAVWSTKMLVKFLSSTVMPAIANRNYESEIKNVGDRVIIRTTPDMEIYDYDKGANLTIQRPESANTDFTVDYAKYFNIICDDIDVYQSDLDLMNQWSSDAGYRMKKAIDVLILEAIIDDADAANKGNSAGYDSDDIELGTSGSPKTVTKANILELIVDLDTVLDEQDAPPDGRWLVIPPWMRGMILKSDLKDASLSGDGQSILRNGRIGSIGSFDIYISNLLYKSSGVFSPLAGQKHGLSFASQLTKVEKRSPDNTFGTVIRGLNVFGFKTLKEAALINMYVSKG